METKVSPQLLDVYNRTAARSGVAIGVLDGNRCGACRTVIDGGRLIDLRNQAPLGYVPLVQAFAGDRHNFCCPLAVRCAIVGELCPKRNNKHYGVDINVEGLRSLR